MNLPSDSEIETLAAEIAADYLTEASWKIDAMEPEWKAAIYNTAHPDAEKRLEEAMVTGEAHPISKAIVNVVYIARELQDYPTILALAEPLRIWTWRSCCSDLRESGSIGLLACFLNEMGEGALARQYMEEQVAMARRIISHDLYLAYQLQHMGRLTGEQGEIEYSRRCFAESLALEQNRQLTRSDWNLDQSIVHRCWEFAQILLDHQRAEEAAVLLAVTQQNWGPCEEAAPIQEWKEFQERIAQAREPLDQERFDSAWNRGLTMTLAEIQKQHFSFDFQLELPGL